MWILWGTHRIHSIRACAARVGKWKWTWKGFRWCWWFFLGVGKTSGMWLFSLSLCQNRNAGEPERLKGLPRVRRGGTGGFVFFVVFSCSAKGAKGFPSGWALLLFEKSACRQAKGMVRGLRVCRLERKGAEKAMFLHSCCDYSEGCCRADGPEASRI